MKYIKTSLAIIAAFIVILVYLIIPNKIVVSKTIFVHQPGNLVVNAFMSIQYWDKWMPYKKIEGHSFIFENGKMEVGDAFLSTAKCIYSIDDVYVPVIFTSVDAGNDSSLIRYECNLYNRYISPVTRIQNYFIAKKIQQQLIPIMSAAKKYYSSNATQDSTLKK